jgi:glycosyltransferase involved in cell wall biosynthesis
VLNLLFVTPYLPSPPGFGGQRRIHGLLTGLARNHRVSVVSLVRPDESHEVSLRTTREYCREVVTVSNPAFALTHRGKRALQLRSLASSRSFEWLTHVLPEMSRAVRELTARERFDVVTFEFSHLAPYRRAVAGDPRPICVLDEHNIEFEILRRTAASESGLVRRAYNSINWRKLRREELSAWREFDGCAVTSDHDEKLLQGELPGTRTAIVPNAVDLEFFQPRPATVPEPSTILFFGALNYFPNTDGLLFFVQEIFPKVRAALPSARLIAVGYTPDHLRSLAGPSIDMKGFVPDVRVELERAAAVIAPLRLGGGTRLKILEAMAMGKPVVSTPEGAEGLQVEDGRDLLLASSPETFAERLVKVLKDAALSRKLGENARKLVEERYGWQASVARLEALYARLGARI